MPISNKISSTDINRVQNSNSGGSADGFEASNSSNDTSGFDDLFDSLDFGDEFGDESDSSSSSSSGSSFGSSGGSSGESMDSIFGSPSGGNSFGGNNSGFGQNNGGFGQGGFGQSNNGFGQGGFGQSNNGFGQPYSPFGTQQVNAQPQQPDKLDLLIDASIQATEDVGSVYKELVQSFKYRTADDVGFFCTRLIKTDIIIAIASILSILIANITKVSILGIHSIGGCFLFASLTNIILGVMGLMVSSLVLEKQVERVLSNQSLNNIPEEPKNEDNKVDEYDDIADDLFDDLFDNEFDSAFSNDSKDDSLNETPAEEEPKESKTVEIPTLNFDEIIDNVSANRMLTREMLVDTFLPSFMKCHPEFSDTKELDREDSMFIMLKTACFKALSNVANVELEDLNSDVDKITESFYAYTIYLKRISKVKNTDSLAREVEIYTRENDKDTSVNASITIEGDYYKIILTKGVNDIVTFGDAFTSQKVVDYFRDTSNKLPIIMGIDELGNVLTADAAKFDSMMICGRPRSGKSWYVFSILLAMILFNTPNDIAMVCIDPKESNLFKKLSLAPHVIGLHNDTYIMDIFKEIIDVEAPRRRKLLADYEVDDIWALRKKGLELPVLYIVIDEFMTVMGNLEQHDDKNDIKKFKAQMSTIITQLPSLGIRLLFIPHRAQGVVSKVDRNNVQFTCAVRATQEVVNESLDISNWKRALVQPGDIALKTASMPEATYVRGAAITTSDDDNSKYFEFVAKAFYKMGVELPDFSHLKVTCNRDEDAVKATLTGGKTTVQYDPVKILEELNDI